MTLRRVAYLIIGGLVLLGAVAAIIAFAPATRTAASSGETWTCSMHPQIRLPNPGRCPICGMQLIPVSQMPRAKSDLDSRAGLQVEPIQRRPLFKEIRTVGKLDYSERQVELISARVAGRVDRVFADFTGMEVKQGDHLVEIYSPELYSAQNELILGLDARDKQRSDSPMSRSLADSRLEASRTKLRLLGILDEQIQEIEESRRVTTELTIYAPLGGTVIEKNIRVGQYIAAGDALYRIANLDPIWLYLNIYEYDVGWIRFGQPVEVTLEAFPGETFTGTVTFIDPFLDDRTRTIRVRVNIKNPDRRLKPQMFASGTIRARLRADGTPETTGLEGRFICPMHPEIVRDEPGKCPICGMPLEKVPDTRKASATPNPSASSPHSSSPDHGAHHAHPPSPAPPAANHPAGTQQQHHVSRHAEHPAAQASDAAGTLAIPVSAVLDTGRRRITYRLNQDGAYELVELELGPRASATDGEGQRRDYFLILDGLKEGELVVSQGGFLLDSQRQIEGMPSLLFPAGQSGTNLHGGHGGHAAGHPSPTADPASQK